MMVMMVMMAWGWRRLGNLGRCERVARSEWELYVRSDLMSPKHSLWYASAVGQAKVTGPCEAAAAWPHGPCASGTTFRSATLRPGSSWSSTCTTWARHGPCCGTAWARSCGALGVGDLPAASC
jgi:hypothetical protein